MWRHHVRTVEHDPVISIVLATIATCLSVFCLSINTDVCCKQIIIYFGSTILARLPQFCIDSRVHIPQTVSVSVSLAVLNARATFMRVSCRHNLFFSRRPKSPVIFLFLIMTTLLPHEIPECSQQLSGLTVQNY